jgi:hypothetical protein
VIQFAEKEAAHGVDLVKDVVKRSLAGAGENIFI